MDTSIGRDRLREFLEIILSSLDEEIDGPGIAARGCLSRYHFDRLVSSALSESPGAFRRRILLERAAWELRSTRATIIKIALRSGYRSAEAFTRAFSRSFGMTPARYRQGLNGFRLDAPNGIHFHPPGGITVPEPHERSKHMDFVDRMVGHDIWFTTRLLDRAGEMPPEALDRAIAPGWGWGSDGGERETLRSILNEMVSNKENWSATLTGRSAPKNGGKSLTDMKQRYALAGKEFADLVRGIKDRGDWDAGFVDTLCDPPQSFTYGGMLAHVVTFSAFRRTMAVFAFRELGVHDIGLGDPIEWERSLD